MLPFRQGPGAWLWRGAGRGRPGCLLGAVPAIKAGCCASRRAPLRPSPMSSRYSLLAPFSAAHGLPTPAGPHCKGGTLTLPCHTATDAVPSRPAGGMPAHHPAVKHGASPGRLPRSASCPLRPQHAWLASRRMSTCMPTHPPLASTPGYPMSSPIRYFSNFAVAYDTSRRNPAWVLEYVTRETSSGPGDRWHAAQPPRDTSFAPTCARVGLPLGHVATSSALSPWPRAAQEGL